MIAVFISGNLVTGYKQVEYEGEEETFELPYRLYADLPAKIASIPEGYYVAFDDDTAEFVHLEIPPVPEPEKTPEQIRIEQLESDNLTLMEAVADLYEMILLGGAV